jgi:type IV pilus assembly protein PilM
MSTIVGVDIGSNAVRAVEVQSQKGKPVILRSLELPLPEGSVRRGEVIEVATVATTLRRLWSTAGFTSKDVALGMGGPRVFARDLMVPRAPLAQIREALPFHVQDLLPVPVSEALLDFYPISEETTEEGPMVDGLLVAAIKEAVTANVAAVLQAGLNPVHVDLVPFALTRALSPLRDTAEVSVLVAVGANTTNVIVSRGGVPHFVRIIAAGGDDITRALALRLSIDYNDAETLKRTIGMTAGGPADRPALDVIYEVVGEQLQNLRTTLSYWTTSKKAAPVQKIVLTGGATHLFGFDSAVSEMIGLPVEQAATLGGAELSRKAKDSSSTLEQQDALSTAFGLALGTNA